MDLDFRQLSYFVALFEEQSATRAASRMNIVQPALSMQIAKLEQALGQNLFERTPKAMIPTPAGRMLYRLVQPILGDLAAAREAMARLAHATIAGRVRIGILSSLANSVVPDVLLRFTAMHPDVELSMAEGYSSTFIDWVAAGELDLAIVNTPHRPIGLVSHPLLDEEMVVAGGQAASLPAGPVRMHDLPRLKLALPSRRHGLRSELERHLAEQAIALNPMVELDSTTALADFAARGDWFTVLPSLAIGRLLEAGTLAAWRIVAPRIARRLIVVHRPEQPMSPAATLLVEMLGEALAEAAMRIRPRIIGADRDDQPTRFDAR